ncbi:MAG: DUF2254 domain-containing protein [Rhodospirillales bacterium]|nr:DUF2254 domain-containing protein [Rhodospirillales bacterium]
MRSSYWFIPSLMFLGAIILSILMVRLDIYVLRNNFITDESWFPKFEAEAARSILSTIASGMVTVAGVVFSLTIVSLQLASSQFGPRLLRTFMNSLGNQIVLGTFTATFLYCLILIGTVRDRIDFVPQLSVVTGILLGVIDVAVLIFFIHHVATSIRIESLIATVTTDLRTVIDRIFPVEIGEEPPDRGVANDARLQFDKDSAAIRARSSGYVRHVDGEMLLAIARHHDLVLHVDRKPGDFVVEGATLFRVVPSERVTEEVTGRILDSTVLGRDRTPSQDMDFALRQLVEVALRALSPGINDPFTAVECVNRLGEALCIVVRRPEPSAYRVDDNGVLRVIAEPLGRPEMIRTAFDPIARAGGSNGDVAARILEIIITIATYAKSRPARIELIEYANALEAQMNEQLALPRDRNAVATRFAAALRELQNEGRGGKGVAEQET